MFQGQQGGTKRGSSTHGDDQHWGGMDCSGAGGGGGGGGGSGGGCHDEDHGGAYDAHRKRTRRSSPSPPRGPAGMFRELSVQDEDGAAMGDSMGATVRDSSMGSMGSSEGGCSEGGCSEDGGGERGGGEGGGGAVEVAVKMIGGRLEHMALPFGAVVRDIKVELEEKRGVERTQIVLIHKGKVCGDMERATAGALYMHCHPQSGCNR